MFSSRMNQDASIQKQGPSTRIQHGETTGCYGEVSRLIFRIKIVFPYSRVVDQQLTGQNTYYYYYYGAFLSRMQLSLIWYLSNTYCHCSDQKSCCYLIRNQQRFLSCPSLVIPPQTHQEPHTVKLGGQKFTSFSQTNIENK